MDIRERVARAIFIARDGAWNYSKYRSDPRISEAYQKDADAAIAAVREADQEAGMVLVQGWQPIETAPKDGTQILAYWLRRAPNGARYEAQAPYVTMFWERRWFPLWVKEDDLPTHWMPLPAAPVPNTEAEG